MRARRPGDVRTRSPPANIRDNGSIWRQDPYPPPRRDTREERLPRSLRSLSPPELERSQRILGGNRRSTSVERRDYTRYLDGGRHARLPPIEQSRNWSQFVEGFPHRDSPSVEYRRQYLLPEAPDLNEDANPSLKHGDGFGPSTSGISKEMNFQATGSPTLDGHGMQVQKSMYLDYGTVQTFFTLPLDVGPTINSGKIGGNFLPSSEGNSNIRLHEDGGLWNRDHFNSNKISARDSYKEEENIMFNPRDISDPMMTLSHSKAFGSSSSGHSVDDFPGSYRDGLPLPSDGYGRSSVKFTGPFGCDGHGQAPPFDSVRDPNMHLKDLASYQLNPLSPDSSEPRDYSYHEFGRREKGGPGYLPNELCRKMQPSVRGDYASRDSLRPIESSQRNMRERGLWDHYSLKGESVSNYLDVKRTSLTTERDGDFWGSGDNHLVSGMKVSRDSEITRPEEDYGFGRDAGLASYKERLKSSPVSECDPDVYRFDVNPPRRLNAKGLGLYDQSERALKRTYAMDVETSRHNPRSLSSNNRNTSRRILGPSCSDEQWTGEDLGGLSLAKRLNFGHLQYQKARRPYDRMATHRLSASDDRLPSNDLSAHVQGRAVEPYIPGGGNVNIKRRLRPGPLNFHNSYHLDRRQNFYKPYKFWKRSLDDRYGGVNVQYYDPSEDWSTPAKSGPPENSEEFKQLVHTAFLQFSKQLNENPAHRRIYREQGKAGSLLCTVCGSLSKEFVDTRSLVTHTFMSLKVGLRADHLGFYKALCVLMGWNSVVAPDSAWVYQVLPEAEALAVKEDLILWPPLVIIHNSSIGNKNPDGQKVITIEGMEAILRDMGFGGGKTKVWHGKPTDQSIMVVKFMPTFSGLQEAERLHKYYTENKRGREEFQQINSNNCNSSSEEVGGMKVNKGEFLLYGYMGIAEDLDKLDSKTKKRCLVKSKKDIQAIADAPLKAD